MPSSTQPAGELMNFGHTASAAGDQDKVCSHTTHNISFYFCSCFASRGRESILRLAAALRIELFQELVHLAYDVFRGSS